MYVKLFSSILDSSLWSESPHIKLVWITMLLVADQKGFVDSTIPGIARRAGVPVDQAEAAVKKFLGTDKHSRTPDQDGARITVMPGGGWRLVNYERYRSMRSAEDRRDYMRDYMRDYRKQNVNPRKPPLAHAEADAEADVEKNISIEEIYQAYPRKVGKRDALKAIEQAITRSQVPYPAEFLLDQVEQFAASPAGQNGKFTPHPATWFNHERYNDDPAEWLKPGQSTTDSPTADRQAEMSRRAHDKQVQGFRDAEKSAATQEEKDEIFREWRQRPS